jgi:hypothetical protein
VRSAAGAGVAGLLIVIVLWVGSVTVNALSAELRRGVVPVSGVVSGSVSTGVVTP